MLKKCLLADAGGTFEEYLSGLSESGRRKYRQALKWNEGREYTLSSYNKEEMTRWMAFWATQKVYGTNPVWSIRPAHYDRLDALGTLRVFKVGNIGLHAAEHCGDYVYGHPPLYDKSKHPELARFMWFGLIEWACQNAKFVDLGPKGHRNAKYKDIFISRYWRGNPPPFKVQVCKCGWRQLVEQREPCVSCGG